MKEQFQVVSKRVQQLPFYKICPPWALDYFKGKKISVLGKIVDINQAQQTLQLEIDPQLQIEVTVQIDPYEMKYLVKEYDANDTLIEDDDTMIERIIKNKQNKNNIPKNSTQIVSSDGYWFIMKKSEYIKNIMPKNSPQKQELNKNKLQTIQQNPQQISIKKFVFDQYIQVRGQCIDSKTIKMQQFTDFQFEYNLADHNEVLRQALINCQHILY